VHDLLCAHNFATEGGANGLMPEANAENWLFTGIVFDDIDRDARLGGRAGSRRDANVIGCSGIDFFQSNLVIAVHPHVLA